MCTIWKKVQSQQLYLQGRSIENNSVYQLRLESTVSVCTSFHISSINISGLAPHKRLTCSWSRCIPLIMSFSELDALLLTRLEAVGVGYSVLGSSGTFWRNLSKDILNLSFLHPVMFLSWIGRLLNNLISSEGII